MKTLLLLLCFVGSVQAGDTYDAFTAKGDYYAPRPINQRQIIVVPDSHVTEPRWQPMLDDRDLKRLIFTEARRSQRLYIQGF